MKMADGSYQERLKHFKELYADKPIEVLTRTYINFQKNISQCDCGCQPTIMEAILNCLDEVSKNDISNAIEEIKAEKFTKDDDLKMQTEVISWLKHFQEYRKPKPIEAIVTQS